MHRWIERLTTSLLRFPGRWTVFTLLLFGLLGCFVFGASKDLSFVGIANKKHPLIARYLRVSRSLNLGGHLPLLLESTDEDKLDKAVTLLQTRLPRLKSVQRVVSSPPQDWLEQRAPWWVPSPVYKRWLRLVTHPGDVASRTQLLRDLKTLRRRQRRFRRKGARLLLVQMSHDPMARDLGNNGFEPIEQTTRRLLAPLGIRAEYAGFAAIFAQDQRHTLRSVQWLTPISLLLVLLLLLSLERRPLRLLCIAIPLLLSVWATLGLLRLLLPQITLGVTFFGVLVFGLGVDFALHWIVRFREEQSRGRPLAASIRATMHGTGSSIFFGALTTAGAFFLVSLAPDTMAHHLGLSGALGLLMCLLAMLILLPAFWILLQKRNNPPPKPFKIPFLQEIAAFSTRYPHEIMGVSLLVLAGAVAGLPNFRYETNLRRIFNRQISTLQTVDRLKSRFQLHANPWLVVEKDLNRARQIASKLKRHPLIARVDSLVSLFPPDRERRLQQLQRLQPTLSRQGQMYAKKSLQSSGQAAKEWMLCARLVALLEQALRVGLPSPENLPASLRSALRTQKGEWVVLAYAKKAHLDGRKARQERLAIQKIAPKAVSFHFLLEAVLAQKRPWVGWVFGGILLFVLTLLWWDFRSWRWVWVALTPVVFGAGVTFGLLCWWDWGFNVMSVLVVPLILGLGVDDGLHVVHRLREEREHSTPAATAAVGQAILLTTLTTVISVSTLLFTGHAGLEGMAVVLLLGLPLCLLASITLLPALVTLLRLRPRR
jgi:predicted exporter